MGMNITGNTVLILKQGPGVWHAYHFHLRPVISILPQSLDVVGSFPNSTHRYHLAFNSCIYNNSKDATLASITILPFQSTHYWKYFQTSKQQILREFYCDMVTVVLLMDIYIYIYVHIHTRHIWIYIYIFFALYIIIKCWWKNLLPLYV